jgi:hypothetical protein
MESEIDLSISLATQLHFSPHCSETRLISLYFEDRASAKSVLNANQVDGNLFLNVTNRLVQSSKKAPIPRGTKSREASGCA